MLVSRNSVNVVRCDEEVKIRRIVDEGRGKGGQVRNDPYTFPLYSRPFLTLSFLVSRKKATTKK